MILVVHAFGLAYDSHLRVLYLIHVYGLARMKVYGHSGCTGPRYGFRRVNYCGIQPELTTELCYSQRFNPLQVLESGQYISLAD